MGKRRQTHQTNSTGHVEHGPRRRLGLFEENGRTERSQSARKLHHVPSRPTKARAESRRAKELASSAIEIGSGRTTPRQAPQREPVAVCPPEAFRFPGSYPDGAEAQPGLMLTGLPISAGIQQRLNDACIRQAARSTAVLPIPMTAAQLSAATV